MENKKKNKLTLNVIYMIHYDWICEDNKKIIIINDNNNNNG